MADKWTDRGDGLLELKNERGEVLATQKTKEGAKRVTRPGKVETHHYVLDQRGKKTWVPKGTNPDHLPREFYPFSQVTVEHILQFITEGETLSKIAKREEMPPLATIYRWMREYPEFKSQMAEAKKMRAEWRADQVMAIADDEDIAEEDVPGRRLRKDILSWGAEMDDRSTYGKQTKVLGDASQPVVFQVLTGVPEPLDAGPPVELTKDGRLITQDEVAAE